MTTCSIGASLFVDWVMPERLLQPHLGKFYQSHPVMGRVAVTPLAIVSGLFKALLFPLQCLVGVVVMPIIALIRHCQGKPYGGGWPAAWGCALVGLAGSLAIGSSICFSLTGITSFMLLAAIFAMSVSIHVYYLLRETPPPLA